jgi:hypothetical protein
MALGEGRCGDRRCTECYDPDPAPFCINWGELDLEIRTLRSKVANLEELVDYRFADLEELVGDYINEHPAPTPLHIKVDCNHQCNPGGGRAELRVPSGLTYYEYRGDQQHTYTGTDSTTP